MLHGYGMRADIFLRSFRSIAGPDRLVVAPEALSRFYVEGTRGNVGASWMTREARDAEILDYVEFLDSVREQVLAGLQASGSRIVILGFSQGAATAARWALRGTGRVDRLILWGGLLPPDIDVQAERPSLERMKLRILVGDRDRYIDTETASAEADRLGQIGLPDVLHIYSGDHRVEGVVLKVLASGLF